MCCRATAGHRRAAPHVQLAARARAAAWKQRMPRRFGGLFDVCQSRFARRRVCVTRTRLAPGVGGRMLRGLLGPRPRDCAPMAGSRHAPPPSSPLPSAFFTRQLHARPALHPAGAAGGDGGQGERLWDEFSRPQHAYGPRFSLWLHLLPHTLHRPRRPARARATSSATPPSPMPPPPMPPPPNNNKPRRTTFRPRCKPPSTAAPTC